MSKYTVVGIKPHAIYSGQKIIELLREAGLEVQPELRKYDWGKTLDDVLVTHDRLAGFFRLGTVCRSRVYELAGIWQPNIHGECPVDPEACHVKLKFSDGHEWHGKASDYEWSHPKDGTFPALIAWQFVRLADGYEW